MQSQKITASPAQTKRRNPQPLDAARDPESLLTMATASAKAGVSAVTLYRKAAAGELKLIKIGKRCTRIRSGDLSAWLAAQS